jgi:predicted regulator of Ras-like GTPase activity (Roadblock/LC7/MglB family)
MERDLQQISNIEDVAGAFVCDNASNVIASSEPAVLATVTMQHIGRVAAQVFEAMRMTGRTMDRAEFQYDTWTLFARDFGKQLALVVCQPGADMSVVRMSVDMAAVRWKADKGVQKRLSKHETRRDGLLTRPNLDEAAWRSWRLLSPQAGA